VAGEIRRTSPARYPPGWSAMACARTGVEIGAAGLTGGQAALAVTVFAVLAASFLLIPVLMVMLAPQATATVLDAFRGWLLLNSHVILSVVLVLMAANLAGLALSGLGS